ncbi:Nif3-like dinuclear metal center hexameric protein [Alkaliphilus hydrothermalis]|uniref:GTP cyclohydrolase 1 type 2 homolog n=1 Tax=Alkaliphilus hydrothermalis TaxID=1482730 RepID=A0ABS2NNV1_9FIRM|nr:Nif3-like dinuclear metal center hexameric protein [Alkaliphilus hydrothermalis]MBM7614626.1 dinuclear metal center YbgI/SA1388 family protein [Alkaliphilus hydrothermalis]
MAERVKDIIQIIENLAPKSAAESWDKVGLQVGSPQDTIKKVLVCLDVTDDVMEEAIENEVNLIISHHPFLFKPLKHILKEDSKGKIVYQAIKNNIALYCCHTNIDVVMGGLNDQVAMKLGLSNIKILQVTGQQEYYKIVVFVPEGYEEKVATALAETGAGHIGNYSHCSFRSDGTGTFMPLEGTDPFIGNIGELEKVKEIRLETIIKKEDLSKSLKSMMEAHPYEEVAYDVYPLINAEANRGIGRVGVLDNPLQLSILIEDVKKILDIDKVKFCGDVNHQIEKVAVVNGSGADLIFDAIGAKCDCLITGDLKYHEAQIALENGLNVIDAGHFETEALFVDWMVAFLTEGCKEKGLDIDVIPSNRNINPFQYL